MRYRLALDREAGRTCWAQCKAEPDEVEFPICLSKCPGVEKKFDARCTQTDQSAQMACVTTLAEHRSLHPLAIVMVSAAAVAVVVGAIILTQDEPKETTTN